MDRIFANYIFQKVFLILFGLLLFSQLIAQNTPDSLRVRYYYRPSSAKQQDSIAIPDSQYVRQQFVHDSIEARLEFIRDSIQARLKFIQDSIIAREKFVRDSIQRRKRILDSVTFLQAELPRLIDASIKTVKEDVIIYTSKVIIIGDSILSNYRFNIVPFDISKPFTPWKSTINLSTNPIKFTVDTIKRKITSIQAPFFNCTYMYGHNRNILRINEQGIIVQNSMGKLYKAPIDSVFFDRFGRITKIKRYNQFYKLVNNYQKGAPLYLHLSQVKQFEYNSANEMTKYHVVNFCELRSGQTENKVCNIVTYTINAQGRTYAITRHNDPVNEFSDGVFTVEFDYKYDPKSLSFVNKKNTENWKCFVELNEAGNVSSYVYQTNGVVERTLLVNYYLDDPHAKHKVETITCTFEDDNISYFQKNNTTGKSRTRDRLTLEWGPWR